MTTEEIRESRKRWTREETLLLLQCYSARKDEFKHSRKKKFAFANVLEDILGRGFLDTTITIRTLESKMRTLLLAYKTAMDNNRQTGATYCQAPFMEEMNEIFGREPIISNSHTLNLGSGVQRPLSQSCASPDVESCSQPLSSSSGDSSANTESLCNVASTSRDLSNANRDPLENAPASSGDSCSTPESLCFVASTSNRGPLTIATSNSRKRKSAKEIYYEQKVELKKKFYEDIKNMISEKLNRP